MTSNVNVYLAGSGDKLDIKSTVELRGYNVVGAWMNRNTGVLEISVEPVKDIAPLYRGAIVCYSDGTIKQAGKVVEKGTEFKIGNHIWSYAEMMLRAFGIASYDKHCEPMFLDGDTSNYAISNLRWR